MITTAPSPDLPASPALVIGAAGFIGSALCRRLRCLGIEVHGAGRSPSPDDAACDRWWTADFGDPAAARAVIEGARARTVFHLAGEVNGSRDPALVLPTFHSNLAATVGVLTAAAALDCARVVIAGSMEEPDCAGPHEVASSPYAVSKWAATAYARMFHALYATPVVIARTFMVYGPGQRTPSKLIPYVIRSLLGGEAPRLSSGVREIDWIYIDDVAEGLIRTAARRGLEGSTIDLGSGTAISIRALIDRLVAIVGVDGVRPEFGAAGDRPMEQVRTADVGTTFQRLGWRPGTSLDDGLRSTVSWFARQGTR